MVKRHVCLTVCVYLTTVAAMAQSSYVFQLPGATSIVPTQILGEGDNDFSRFLLTTSAPTGASAVVATPTGSKFYILAPGGVFSANANVATHTLTAITPVAGIAGAANGKPNTVQVTPDGKYLLIITDQFYIVNTSTNTLAVTANTGVPAQSAPVSVAVSHDAKTAWVLSSGSGGGVITTLSLTTLTTSSTLSLLSEASFMVLSSRNLLYVTSTGSTLYEVDPITLTLTNSGKIEIPNGTPGPLQFTPDGNSAYFLNRASCAGCPPIFKLNVQAHAVSGWLPTDGNPSPALDQVLVAGNNRVFALSPTPECGNCRQLWDVAPTPLSLSPSALGALPTKNVVAGAVSNERASARYLYLMISDHSFYRVNLASSGIDQISSLDPANGTILSFVPVPAQSGAASLFPINPTQSVAPNGTTVLIGQVLDPVGRPVFGAAASFSAGTCAGITITTPSIVTTSEGWAQTAITAPPVSGSCTVTLKSGALSTDFQLIVGGGDNTGSSKISIFSGDGQLLRPNETTLETQQPLKVRVTDAAGNPLANVHVIFARTEGKGSVTPLETDTDISGFASTDFTSESLAFGVGFELSKVSATSSFGSVEFYETTQLSTDVHQTNTAILTPADQHLTIPQGGFLAAGITVLTSSGITAGPIPNVGLRLADVSPNLNSMSPVASCAGLSRGDNAGISRCDVQAACMPGISLPHEFAAILQVGEFKSYFMNITLTGGVPSLLSLVSGNNQTGAPTDSITLAARVTDGCNQASGSFSGLTWTVTQGAASLSQQQTTTDSNGNVTARVTLGQTAGPVKIQLSGPNLTPIVFNLTVQISVSGITLVSGSGQSAIVGQPFANPVVFVARGPGGAPAPAGLVVNFTVSGSATVNPGSAATNAQGQVQTSVTAGATPGNIVITATYSSFTATATLSSRAAGPVISITSFINAASGAVGMTPCGLVTVKGTGIAPTPGIATGQNFFGILPYTLAGLSITANNIPVPIHSVINDQFGQRANFQVPCELTPGTANMVVTVNGATTSVFNVPVNAVQPGIFTYTGPNNKVYGTVIRAADGTFVTPSNPAHRGEQYYMIVTGLGKVTPATVTNAYGTGSQNVSFSLAVGIHDLGVPVLSGRYLAGYIGAYRVDFMIPADAPLGTDQNLAVAAYINDAGDLLFGNQVLLPGVVEAVAP